MILALDPAATCGFAFGDGKTLPHASIWQLPGFADADCDRSFGNIYSAVRGIVTENRIEGLMIESPLRLDGKSAHTERMLTMLSGAARAGAHNGGVKWIKSVAPTSWRKAVLGNGFPKNPKQAALEYCRLRGWRIDDHNAGEAACILVHAHDQAKIGAIG